MSTGKDTLPNPSFPSGGVGREGPCSGNISHHEVEVNGVRLHYVAAGVGPLVVLLHGFPEFWYSWRHQIQPLAAAGFRVLAPDLRGYNTSDKPAGLRHYRIETLLDDVAGLITHIGAGRASIVGHDWGGVLTWLFPLRHPQLIEKRVILNAPHPAAFRRALWTSTQLLKSWYVFFFQIPWLPERLLRRGNFAWLERCLRREPVRPQAFSTEDIDCYRQALAQPGALTAALNYYRALLQTRRERDDTTRTDVPTLLIWGARDRYLGLSLTQGLERWVNHLRIERLADASHWVQYDAPEQVNRLLLEFLREG